MWPHDESRHLWFRLVRPLAAVLLTTCQPAGALLLVGLLVFAPPNRSEAQDAQIAGEENPGRPQSFIFPTATSDVKEALDDFAKYSKRGQWEKAFAALAKARSAPKSTMLADKNSFYFPVPQRLQGILAELPPEGKDAYRLFFDAEARKLLGQANGKEEADKLSKVFDEYFMTASGADAADRLGDLSFEQGALARAVECWRAVLKYHTGSAIAPVWLHVKLATALARSERWDEFRVVQQYVRERFAAEAIVIGGKRTTAGEYVDKLGATAKPPVATSSDSVAAGADAQAADFSQPLWRFRLVDDATAQALSGASQEWGWNVRLTVSEMVPPVAVDDKRIYVNLLGRHFAVDLNTGKLLWRSARFDDLKQMVQNQQTFLAEQFGISIDGPRLWCVTRKQSGQQNRGQVPRFELACLDPETGKETWSTASVSGLNEWAIMGLPVAVGDRVYVTGYQMQKPTELNALCLEAKTGKLVWASLVGTFPTNYAQSYYYARTPQPAVVYLHGRLYVQTHSGGLAELDADNGAMRWGLAYESEIPNTNYWDYYQMPTSMLTAGAPVFEQGVLYAKGMRSTLLCAVDLGKPALLWSRPVGSSAMLVGFDEQRMYFGGEEAIAIDRKTRTMLWATRLPAGSGWIRPLITPNSLLQFTPRGIFEIDKATGNVSRISRGSDQDCLGGRMFATPKAVITVSNLAITAYPATGSRARAAAERK